MDLFSILTLIGGLALFLYGMNAMGDGLAKVSGGKLEKILENLTSNPIKAVLLGAGDRKSTRLNSSHEWISRMPSSA